MRRLEELKSRFNYSGRALNPDQVLDLQPIYNTKKAARETQPPKN